MLWIILAAVLIAAIAFALHYGYKLAFYYDDPCTNPLEYGVNDQVAPVKALLDEATAEFDNASWEPVSIRSKEGLELTGRFYSVCPGAPVEIFCHGYKGNAVRDFCGAWRIAKSLGHNVLLINQRCHGGSQGHTITFGIREKTDVTRWIDYVNETYAPAAIVISGVSMGAATVLMASGMALPENVKAVIADCPYDAPTNIIRKVLGQDMHLPVGPVYPLIRLGGMVYGGFDLNADSPVEAVKRSKLPILLIHGDDDRFVPHCMSVNIHAAAPGKIRFHTISGAGHALNYLTAPEDYSKTVKEFLGEVL